ncbi:MAG: hypothetical protein ACYTHJ_11455 [Planctomycetota bacterium]|jgi:hypothetical protein
MNDRKNALLSVSVLLLAALPVLAESNRVTICHIPPGDPDNAQTITVSEHALEAHLAHGDVLGSCDDLCNDSGACDDGDACTSDSCEGSLCVNEPIAEDACDDGIPWTDDSCDSAQGCVNFFECEDATGSWSSCGVQHSSNPGDCGFYQCVWGSGYHSVFDPNLCTCVDSPTVQIQVKFESNAVSVDPAQLNACLNAYEAPDIVTDCGVANDPFGTTLSSLECELIKVLESFQSPHNPIYLTHDDLYLQAVAEIEVGGGIAFDVLAAIRSDALPTGASESTVVSVIRQQWDLNNDLFTPMQAELTSMAEACGTVFPEILYITVDVY